MSDLLLYIAIFGLFFSHFLVLAFVSICGHILTMHPAFSRALIYTLFTVVYNLFLKSIWQVPLPEPLSGWAFPSGHTHTMLVFWGWLAIEARSLFFILLVAIIALLQGYGLLYQGYHHPIDIVGAWGFATVSLFVFWLLNSKVHWIKNRPELFGLLLSFMCLIFIVLLPESMQSKAAVWQAHGALIGWIMGLMMCHSVKKPAAWRHNFKEKLIGLALLIAILGILFNLMNAPQRILAEKNYDFITNFMLCFIAASWPVWIKTIKKYLPQKK